jgi:alkylation response protein AidB-like acyl-CoA dehydrogenase
MGLCGMPEGELTFTNLIVPEAMVLRPPGGFARGFAQLINAYNSQRGGAGTVAMGIAAGALDHALEWAKGREQFGRPIGTFQSLQHRAAEMMVSLEEARSMAMLAAMMAQEPDALERRRQMSAVKVQIGRSGKFIGQSAIQLHGGIAMTMEYLGGHYFKRLTTIDTMFGDADHHLTQLMAMGGLNQAA